MKQRTLLFGILLNTLLLVSCNDKKTKSEGKEIEMRGPGYAAQWFERHKDKDGKIPENLHHQWFQHDLNQFQKLEQRGNSPIASVNQLGLDDNQGGRTRAVLIDVRDSNRMFAGCVSGGLWRSVNGGATWSPINDAASSLAVTCIAQNPRKPTEIYYGTGEQIGGDFSSASGGLQQLVGNGVFKSTDGGLTFNLLPSTEGVSTMQLCNDIEHSLVNDSTVFLATPSGLFRSTNAGGSWSRVLTGFTTHILCFPDGHVLVSVRGNGLFYSTDGSAFERVSSATLPDFNFTYIPIDYCKTRPNVVYAWYTNFSQNPNSGVFRSDDGGKTWAKRTEPSVALRVGTTQGGYNQVIGVHPTNPDRIMVGGQAAVKSNDGGTTWESFSDGHPDHHAYTPIGTSRFFLLGNDGGVYRVDWDGSPTLNFNNRYYTFQFYGGNYAPTGTTALGGTQDNGTWRYVGNRGSEVVSASFPGGLFIRADGAHAHISQQNPDLAYMSIQFGQVFRSSNFSSPGGGTFEKIPLPDVNEGIQFINLFEMNYADGRQLYYRTNAALWRTTNSGRDWERLNINDIANIHAIGISNETDPTVYIGGPNVFARLDKAASFVAPDTFVNLRSRIPINYRSDAWGNISFHPKEKTTLYVGLTSMNTFSRVIKIKNAHTLGFEWIELGGNLPARLPVYQVQAHPDDPDNTLFAATAFGLYYTTDGGKNWVKESRVPNAPIFEMKLRAGDKSLFLFTYGRGAWYLPLNTLTQTKDLLPATAVTLYPNPVSDFMTIESDNPLSMIQVFSTSGREIMTLNQGFQQINLSSLPPNMYVLKAFDKQGRFLIKKFVKM